MTPDGDTVHDSDDASAEAPPGRCPIAGVGASPGVIEALEGFFRGMPRRPEIAIVVTYLSSWRESVLHEIASRFTDMPVDVATDGVPVAENHVYVVPADSIVGIWNGLLVVHRRGAAQRERHPVDIFLGALAADQDEHAGGVPFCRETIRTGCRRSTRSSKALWRRRTLASRSSVPWTLVGRGTPAGPRLGRERLRDAVRTRATRVRAQPHREGAHRRPQNSGSVRTRYRRREVPNRDAAMSCGVA